MLEDERSHHANVFQPKFDCLPIRSPIQLFSLEVKLGAREEQEKYNYFRIKNNFSEVSQVTP